MTTHTIRQATIFISQGDGTSVYSSFDEIPIAERRRLLESTTGPNSATIVIADRGGRAQIVRALKKRPGAATELSMRFPWTEAFARRERASGRRPLEPEAVPVGESIPWMALALLGSAGAAVAWFLFQMR